MTISSSNINCDVCKIIGEYMKSSSSRLKAGSAHECRYIMTIPSGYTFLHAFTCQTIGVTSLLMVVFHFKKCFDQANFDIYGTVVFNKHDSTTSTTDVYFKNIYEEVLKRERFEWWTGNIPRG